MPRPGPTGVEGSGGFGGPGCGAGGRWWSPTAVSTNNSNIQPRQISHAIPPRHGLTHAQKPQNINDQISIVEILLGELHAKLPRSSQDSVPCHDQAQLVWRAPEGLEGLAAPPTGTPSSPAQRAARPSEQPGPAGGPPPTAQPGPTRQRVERSAEAEQIGRACRQLISSRAIRQQGPPTHRTLMDAE